MKQSGRTITITGMMKAEGGQRTTLNCIVTDSKSNKVTKFHPLAIVSAEWENWYITKNRIQLCLQIFSKTTSFTSSPIKIVRRIV